MGVLTWLEWMKKITGGQGDSTSLDLERIGNLARCAAADESSSGGTKLEFIGNEDAQQASRLILRVFLVDELREQVGGKLLATLRDGQRHSFAAICDVAGPVLVSVNTWPGPASEAMPGMQGKWMKDAEQMVALFQQKGTKPSRFVALDYFIRDVERGGGTPFILEVAVSHLPLEADKLPEELRFALLQPGLLSAAERSQCGII